MKLRKILKSINNYCKTFGRRTAVHSSDIKKNSAARIRSPGWVDVVVEDVKPLL